MDWRVRCAVAVMQKEMARPLRLSSLANRVNLSPSRFSHLFRQELGVSPARYLRDLRLDSALMLLYDSTMSIKEVMAAVGFNDPSHFTRDFSKRHDVTPTEFRERAHSCDDTLEAIAEPSGSRIGQQTAAFGQQIGESGQQTGESANGAGLAPPRQPSIVDWWRDNRAKRA